MAATTTTAHANNASNPADSAKASAAQAKATADQATQNAADIAEETTLQAQAMNDRATENAARMVEGTTRRLEEGTDHMREFSSAMMDTSKAGSRMVLDSYARTAHSVFDMQRQMIGASQAPWVKKAAATQIQFAEDVTNAWIRAAHALLK